MNWPQLTSTSHRTNNYLMEMRIWLLLGPWLTIDVSFILIDWEVRVKIEISHTQNFIDPRCIFGGIALGPTNDDFCPVAIPLRTLAWRIQPVADATRQSAGFNTISQKLWIIGPCAAWSKILFSGRGYKIHQKHSPFLAWETEKHFFLALLSETTSHAV